jgi:hypothetical protein
MTMRIEFDTKKFDDEIKKLRKEAPHEVDLFLSDASDTLREIAITSIQNSPGGGRVYKRGSVTHVASKPGDYPKTDTGDLVRNITKEKEGDEHYTVGSRKGAPHGYDLEFGTRRTQPRPWLAPSFEKMLRKLK